MTDVNNDTEVCTVCGNPMPCPEHIAGIVAVEEQLPDADEANRHQFVVQRLQQIRNEMNDRFLEMGQLLLEAHRVGHARAAGYETFEDFIEDTLKISYRAGKYLMDIYEVFVERMRVAIPDLSEIGWSKVKELLPIVNADNVTEWLNYCRLHRTTEVIRAVKQAQHPGEEVAGYSSFSVGVFDDEKQIIKEAIELAARETRNERSGHNLMRICVDYASEARARQAQAAGNDANVEGTEAVVVPQEPDEPDGNV